MPCADHVESAPAVEVEDAEACKDGLNVCPAQAPARAVAGALLRDDRVERLRNERAVCRREARQVVRVVVHEREEALDARAAVVGPLTVVPMWQEQHKSALLAPLFMPRRDELIDDNLQAEDTRCRPSPQRPRSRQRFRPAHSADSHGSRSPARPDLSTSTRMRRAHLRVVGKVAELRLPQDECTVTARDAVAVLKRKHRGLTQRRIDNLDVVLHAHSLPLLSCGVECVKCCQ